MSCVDLFDPVIWVINTLYITYKALFPSLATKQYSIVGNNFFVVSINLLKCLSQLCYLLTHQLDPLKNKLCPLKKQRS
jgi:hypothetical protein